MLIKEVVNVMVQLQFILEPWHSDVFDFLLLRKNHGNEEEEQEIYFMQCGYQIFLWNV